MTTDTTIASLVGDLEKKISRNTGADFYHVFKDRVSVREVAEFLQMDFAQFHRFYRERYPDDLE